MFRCHDLIIYKETCFCYRFTYVKTDFEDCQSNFLTLTPFFYSPFQKN